MITEMRSFAAALRARSRKSDDTLSRLLFACSDSPCSARVRRGIRLDARTITNRKPRLIQRTVGQPFPMTPLSATVIRNRVQGWLLLRRVGTLKNGYVPNLT